MAQARMAWEHLVTQERLGREEEPAPQRHRTNFQQDFDRIVFSSAFRRLQDKTQVFPLAESDYVRTRLTHSLEVSCVGRSLGTKVGEEVAARERFEVVDPGDFGSIVAAACLAHDIGNPPFGHSGEDAIQHWFATSNLGAEALAPLSEQQAAEFRRFEGNAQGLRVVTRLQNPDNEGGLQLTFATLGAALKYPRPAHRTDPADGVSGKKHGYFAAEEEHFRRVVERTGMLPRDPEAGVYCRHPLAFLMEAADDISYQIVDFEDSYRLGLLSFEDVASHIRPILRDDDRVNARLAQIGSEKERVEYLRARAINQLVEETATAFLEREEEILAGRFDRELKELIPSAEAMAEIERTSFERIYNAKGVLEIDAAGFGVLGGLLETFFGPVRETAEAERAGRLREASAHSRTVAQLVPEQFLYDGVTGERLTDPYLLLLNLTDFVSGMTDGYAVSLYKKLTGISLPHRG
ncbi:deoxyguanosinetriphosphate triphosphohydrolase [Thiohalorhabdus denitrificans]|uniref:dGTPase n=1 Tax=Thiohalorhabdus denitrificans TaxID=381306 RepID=A0A1G5CKK5_9GAMM|nr:deoxyguanosinetriphosphate triphosphohydrolase [Thiohalorhabdus denitrificans]SCY02791.1 dGTPase [Thiohalorhabdus denitrificans]